MARVVVYGASDDLIELEGDFYEEFSPGFDEAKEGVYLAFSDGTVLKVHYDGQWTFKRHAIGTAAFTKDDATGDDGKRPDGKPAYSDVVTLDGDLRWAVYGTGYAPPSKRREPK
jgi:hypothetical protein